MSKAKTVKEVFIATEWILVHMNWIQGSFFRNDKGCGLSLWDKKTLLQKAKSCCLSGAMRLVDTTDVVREKARQHFMNTVHESMVRFNDKPGRTKKEVLEVVRKAILSAP